MGKDEETRTLVDLTFRAQRSRLRLKRRRLTGQFCEMVEKLALRSSSDPHSGLSVPNLLLCCCAARREEYEKGRVHKPGIYLLILAFSMCQSSSGRSPFGVSAESPKEGDDLAQLGSAQDLLFLSAGSLRPFRTAVESRVVRSLLLFRGWGPLVGRQAWSSRRVWPRQYTKSAAQILPLLLTMHG